MGSKIIKIITFLTIAILYSLFLIDSSLPSQEDYKSVELKELSDKEIKLPRIDIEGPIEELKDKSLGERQVKIKYTSDNINFDRYATIKVQGSSSQWYDKKNYTIKLYKDDEYIQKYEVDLGWGKERKYVLKANWVDKTHARNIVMARIAAQVQQKYHLLEQTPNNGLIDGYPVEIYANGKYHGLYTLNIPKDEWLYGMDKNNENHIAMVAERWSNETSLNELATYKTWTSQVGSQTEEKLEKFNRMVNFVINSTDDEFKRDLHKYLNIDATLNYHVLSQYFYITDNHGKNQIFVTYDGIEWYPTLYDLDTSFGSYYDGTKLYNIESPINMSTNVLYRRLNELYANELADRYFELRKTIITKENINNQIDKFYNSIPSSAFTKEKNKWGENIPGYEITQLKEFVITRTPVMDEYFKNMYTIEPTCIDNSSVYCKLFNNSYKNI